MPAHPSHRTMVVTSEQALARTICVFLRTAGYESLFASSVGDALADIETHSPHIILIDLDMAGSEGLDLVATLRKQSDLAQILVMSSNPTLDNIIDAYRIGASDYLIMPFENLNILKSAITEASGRLAKWKMIIEKILPEESR